MKNVSRLYRDPEHPSDSATDQYGSANQSSISGPGGFAGPSAFTKPIPISGQSTLDDIRSLLLGDHTSSQTAESERINSRLDSLERHFVAKLDEQSTEIKQLKDKLRQVEHERNSARTEHNALKARSEAAFYEMQSQYARNHEELQFQLENRLAQQSDLLSRSLKQVADLLMENKNRS